MLGTTLAPEAFVGFIILGDIAEPFVLGRFRVVVALDYGDDLDGPPVVEFVLTEAYGATAAEVNQTIAQLFAAREFVELVDVTGFAWPFHRGTVRAFAVRGIAI